MPSPIVQATIQAALLSAASNIFAQVITSYQEDVRPPPVHPLRLRAARRNADTHTQTPFSLHLVPIVQFILLSLLNTPINFLWQEWLEQRFPGSTAPPARAESGPPLAATGERGAHAREKRDDAGVRQGKSGKRQAANVRNVLIKFLLDQTVGAAYNTVSFIAGMGVLRGFGGAQIAEAVKKVLHSAPVVPVALALAREAGRASGWGPCCGFTASAQATRGVSGMSPREPTPASERAS